MTARVSHGPVIDRTSRIALLVAAIWLVVGAIGHFATLDASIDDFRGFSRQYDLDVRRPLDHQALELASSPADASAVVGLAAANDALGGVALGELGERERDAWLAVMPRMELEIEDASDLLRASMTRYPAWAWDRAFLGMLDYATVRRSGRPSPVWMPMLESARRAAPGDASIPAFLASAYLEAWPRLAPDERAAATDSIRLALRDPSFARRAVPFLFDELGHPATYELIPDDPAVLDAVLRIETSEEDIDGTEVVWTRMRRAELESRARDLAAIAERAALGDRQGLRSVCRQWFASRNPYAVDGEEGLVQFLKAFEACPPTRGVWPRDPRVRAISFVRERVSRASDAAPVAKHVIALRDAPAPLQAWARLASGDAQGAMAEFRQAGGVASFEWTPFLVDYAAEAVSLGRNEAALDALGLLAPTARDECQAQMLLSRLSGTKQPVTAIRGANDSSVVLCIDDPGAANVTLRLDSEGESFVVWGWNNGVEGGRRLDSGITEWTLDAEGRSGLQSISIETLAGSRPRIVAAGIGSSEL